MPDDRLPALEEIRERSSATKGSAHGYVPRGERLPGGPCGEWLIANLASAQDVPRLLAVVDKVLKLADDWGTRGDECRAFAARRHAAGNAIPAWISEARAGAFEDCTQALRETIGRELTGEGDRAAT